jgi:tetratricopeptide (TPR) repeat protein
MCRFDRLGEMGDIEKAILNLQDAVQHTPDGHVDKPDQLSNLGNSLLSRFDRLGEMEDIEKAISILEDVVQLTPDGYAAKPRRLSNLGTSLLTRFKRLGQMGDLEKAISSLEDAVRLTPDGHADKPGQLNNLGVSLLTRFERLGEMGDIEKAIASLEDAVRLTPDGHADKSGELKNLGQSLFAGFKHQEDLSYLKRSIFAAFQSATQTTGPASIRFHAAILWSQCTHLCHHDVSVPSLLQAYATAFELLPRVSWLGLSITSRHHELVAARTFACDAAAAAILANRLSMALEWLEQGRSVIWGQILHLRTPLDGLRVFDPKLAAKLSSIAIDLERGNSQAFFAGGDNEASPEQAVQKHRRLANEWERVLEQVRKLPSFERFLLPKQYSELQDAACNGPVVVLNASQYGCDALIIASPLELHHIRLHNLTYGRAHDLQKLLNEMLDNQQLYNERHGRCVLPGYSNADGSFRDLLKELWDLVVRPVRDCLESCRVSNRIYHYAHR